MVGIVTVSRPESLKIFIRVEVECARDFKQMTYSTAADRQKIPESECRVGWVYERTVQDRTKCLIVKSRADIDRRKP